VSSHQIYPDTLHIVVLGSSTAYGVGATSKETSWVGLLEMEYKVTNLAKPNLTSNDILPNDTLSEHNIIKAISLRPDLIIINLPSNDLMSNIHPIEQYDNFRKIQKFTNIPILFTTSQPRNVDKRTRHHLKQLYRLIKDNLLYIDFWTGIATSNGRINPKLDSGDGIHLNDKGHRLLYYRVFLCINNRNILKQKKKINEIPVSNINITSDSS